MEDREWKCNEFKVFVKNGLVHIQEGENNIFIGSSDGGRFGALKDAMSYINEMATIEKLEK